MPSSCSAYNCKNRLERRVPGVSFHRFPLKDPKRLKEWVVRTRWANWTPKPSSSLCSDHFESHCFDRSGHGVRLRDTALPTIFNFPEHLRKKKPPRRTVTLFPETPEVQSFVQAHEQRCQVTKLQQSVKDHSVQLEAIDWSKFTWHPSTFHDDYCEPKSIQWEKDDGQNGDDIPLDNLRSQGLLFIPKRAIKIKGRWEWLGIEVIGPLPIAQRGRRFVLSVMDFYSRWVEVYPMETCSSEEIAQNIYDVVSRIGYPYGFLSRMSPRCIKEVNCALCKHVGLEASYILHHPQVGSLDQTTKKLIDKMVFDLTREHHDGWDVHLPAAVFRLCCSVNPSTHQRPLSLHHSNGATPFVKKPRLLMVEDGGEISRYTFVLLEPQAHPRRTVEVQCAECLNWSQINQPTDLQEYDSLRLKDEEHSYICPDCTVLLEERDRTMEHGLTENSEAVAKGALTDTRQSQMNKAPAREKSKENSVTKGDVLVEHKEQQEGGRLERRSSCERGRPRWWESLVETDAPLQRGGQKGVKLKKKKQRRRGRPRQTKSLIKINDSSQTESSIKAGAPLLENKAV